MANIETLRKNLEAHGFETRFFATKQEAADYLCASLSGTTIGIGGSKTVEALDVYDRLSENNTVYWHWKQAPADEVRVMAVGSDVYISGINGLSETGELVNIDGGGNRLAGTVFNKKRVIFVTGTNKIEPTMEDAIRRARNVASPLNMRRFNANTPCVKSDELKCYDCSVAQRGCNVMQIHMRKPTLVDVCEILLIDEELGF